ncbi:MAG: ABC transporter permease [Acidobacteria bacterium]|nr:MAG: ABC transporter permease [Acidobacteriota bacterium]
MAESSLSSLIGREIRSWGSDPWQLALISWLPLVLFAALWWIFSAGIVTDLGIGVVDLDDSRLSRTLIRQLDATPALRIASRPLSVHEGRRAMSNAEIGALIVIPYDFQARTSKGLKPDVTAFYNGQFILIGKAVKSALFQAQATLAGRIDGGLALAQGAALPQAAGLAVPVVPQLTPLYNRGMDYALFLVPAVIPALWQVVMIIGMLNAIGREHREGSWEQWLEPGPLKAFIGKMLPYVLVYWVMGIGFLLSFHLLGWPVRGSWALIITAQGLTVIATAVMAGFLFVLVDDLPRSLSLAAAYTAPSFAFLGVTFPASDMPSLALFWRSLIPVCHFMDIQISQMSRAADFGAVALDFGALVLFLVVLPLVVLRLAPGTEDS